MTLDLTTKTLQDGIDAGLHVGAQCHVRLRGEDIGGIAIGEGRPGVAMTPETGMIWFSSTKGVTAVAMAMVWERGLAELDAPVVRYLPAFGANGKDAVTIRHCLTHTGGFRFAGAKDGNVLRDLDESWDDVCAAGLEEGWAPGTKAGYHPTSSMNVLAKVIETVDGRHFRTFVRDEIFLPLGMDDCWIGMDDDAYVEERIGVMHNTEGDTPVPLPRMDAPESTRLCLPGGGGRGPMRQLARLYEALRRGGELDGTRILSPQTVEAITARHRTGMFDHTFQIVIDWGLGFIIDAVIYGGHSSPRTFGHGGARSSVGFCDPEAGLVVGLVCNGMPEQASHYRRMKAVCDAIYTDLDLGDHSIGSERATPRAALL
jgi:CubicO group peptidase (beta-lactamase class C family)